jgi:hypothetical protein
MSSEELDIKVKMKAVSGDDAKGYFETPLSIATDAHELVQQLYNFWQYVSFQFHDDSWLANQTKKIYSIMQKNEKAIQSIANVCKDFIILLVSKINNDFHQTLWSCMQANGEINAVNWNSMESLPAKVQGYIDDRERPNFIITDMIKSIINYQFKRKWEEIEADNDIGVDNKPRKRHQGNKVDGDGDEPEHKG